MSKEIPEGFRDAKDLIRHAYSMRYASNEEKERFSEALRDGYESSGLRELSECTDKGLITTDEWASWTREKGFTYENFQPVASVVNSELPTTGEDRAVILTTRGSPLDKQRTFIKERFGLEVTTIQELAKELSK